MFIFRYDTQKTSFSVAQFWTEEFACMAAEKYPGTIYFFGTIKERYYDGAETG